ncbi:hypothetical protein [uncultured Olegusella sp.]|uniref:hypothetical protein n=1 Tax=uncultured Olegusella sp. TaxID=1979846 RepID=UPI00262AD5F8|nr:hypothetical protein [uncultured Olegusella sp.]
MSKEVRELQRKKKNLITTLIVGILAVVTLGFIVAEYHHSAELTRQANMLEEQEQKDIAASKKTYQPEETFSLTGKADSNSNTDLFAQSLTWVGTLQMKVSAPQVFDTAQEAGFAPEDELYIPSDLKKSDKKLLVVEISITNVDAKCKQYVIDSIGCPAILIDYVLNNSGNTSGSKSELAYFSGPALSQSKDPKKSKNYIWAEPGETIKVRCGYFIDGDATQQTHMLDLSPDGDLAHTVQVELSSSANTK